MLSLKRNILRNNPTFLLHKKTKEKKLLICWVLHLKPQKFSPIAKVREKSVPIHHHRKAKIIWNVLMWRGRHPIPLTNISLTGKAEKTLKEYSELHIKNNNAKHIKGANRIFLALVTRSLLAADLAYYQKVKIKNFADSDEQLETSFVKLIKFILPYGKKYIQQQTYKIVANIQLVSSLPNSLRFKKWERQ